MSIIPVRKRYVIFGAGNAGKMVVKKPLPFCYFVDNDAGKYRDSLMGLAIKPPVILLEEQKGECFVIIANYEHSGEIAQQLISMGFTQDEDFADFRECDLDSIPVITYLRVNVTRKCNSHCKMCNVWQDKNANEFAPSEMAGMLKDPFFREVKELLITGGEPTSLRNFPDYLQQAIASLPSLKHVSTVVNGLLPEKTISVIHQCKGACDNAGISLFVSVSLDGLEKENDEQRGIPGSFKKVMQTINGLREDGIPVTVSTTITKINLSGMDLFLKFLQENNLQCHIKLGIQAAFFNNEGSNDLFKYTDDELFSLKRFFLQVANIYKNNEFARVVAVNQFHMLEGSERLLSCPYLECKAATLTENGQLKYCCSKSKELGSIKEMPAALVYQRERKYLSFLEHTNCLDCNSDCFSGQSPNFRAMQESEDYWNGFFSRQEWLSSMADQTLVGNVFHYAPDSILLVGFFGNETEDDGDLLQALIGQCDKEYPGWRIVIASSLPFVTRYMLKKVALGKPTDVIPTHDERFLSACHFVSHILVVAPREPYYPWIKCAEHIASKTGKTVIHFNPAISFGKKEAPAYEK